MRTALFFFLSIYIHAVNGMEAGIRIDFEKTPLQEAITSLASLCGERTIIAPNMQKLSAFKPLTMHVAVPPACLKSLLNTLLLTHNLALTQLDTSDTYILVQSAKTTPGKAQEKERIYT